VTTVTRSPCAVCGGTPAALFEPPHRTLDRGPDPEDDSYSIIVILPEVPLCPKHARQVRDGGCASVGAITQTAASTARPVSSRLVAGDSLVTGARSGSVTKSH
jgi:hypothetical protein